MKTNIKRIALAMCMVFFFTSCEKLLDVEVKSDITDQVYWKNESDYQNNLVGIYKYYRDRVNELTFGEDRSDLYIPGSLSRFSAYWSQVLTPENSRDWQQYYALIGHTNLLLNKIESFPFSNEANKNRIKAEALALRASMYFYIAKIYGDVPLVLDPVVGENMPLLARTPVKDVFVQINKDIDDALSLYPGETITDKYYFSKPSINALKADVNLWNAKVLNGGNQALMNAIAAIQQIEDKSGARLQPEFKDITVRKNQEILFSLFVSRAEATMYSIYAFPLESYSGKADNAAQLPLAGSANTGYATYTLNPTAVAMFSKYPTDKRPAASYVTEITGGKPGFVWPNKFRGTVYSDGRIADDDIIIYRLADILLLKAEAYAALGNGAEALVPLNKVKKRANVPDFTVTETGVLNKEILDERGREMFFENKRWWDLVRAHKWKTIDIYQAVPKLKGKNTPIYWPVNIRPLSLNPNLTQTEGY